MSEKFIGKCLCGKVEFQVLGSFESFFLCHCKRCRKGTGSAHSANLFSKSAKINWVRGQEDIKTYRVPETQHEKSFCRKCGTTLPILQMNGDLLVVPAGSLDSPINIKPSAHILYKSRAEWDVDLDCVQKLDGLPT